MPSGAKRNVISTINCQNTRFSPRQGPIGIDSKNGISQQLSQLPFHTSQLAENTYNFEKLPPAQRAKLIENKLIKYKNTTKFHEVVHTSGVQIIEVNSKYYVVHTRMGIWSDDLVVVYGAEDLAFTSTIEKKYVTNLPQEIKEVFNIGLKNKKSLLWNLMIIFDLKEEPKIKISNKIIKVYQNGYKYNMVLWLDNKAIEIENPLWLNLSNIIWKVAGIQILNAHKAATIVAKFEYYIISLAIQAGAAPVKIVMKATIKKATRMTIATVAKKSTSRIVKRCILKAFKTAKSTWVEALAKSSKDTVKELVIAFNKMEQKANEKNIAKSINKNEPFLSKQEIEVLLSGVYLKVISKFLTSLISNTFGKSIDQYIDKMYKDKLSALNDSEFKKKCSLGIQKSFTKLLANKFSTDFHKIFIECCFQASIKATETGKWDAKIFKEHCGKIFIKKCEADLLESFINQLKSAGDILKDIAIEEVLKEFGLD